MDIEYELEKLIIKYNVDRTMPKFKNYVEAKKMARIFWDDNKESTKEVVLVGSSATDVTWFERNIVKLSKIETFIPDLTDASWETLVNR